MLRPTYVGLVYVAGFDLVPTAENIDLENK
jgi:hypothetical protein